MKVWKETDDFFSILGKKVIKMQGNPQKMLNSWVVSVNISVVIH